MFILRHLLEFLYNLGQITCRLFHSVAQFLFATSETEHDCCHQKVNLQVASRVAEQSKF